MRYFSDNQRHLVCLPYTVENLHRMARDLNIKPCWFDGSPYPHYDIPKLRVLEIQCRTTVVTSKDIIRIIHGKYIG